MNRYRCLMCVLVIIATLALAVFARDQGRTGGPSNAPSGATSKNAAALTNMLIGRERSLAEAEKRKDVDYFRTITTEDFLLVATDAKVYTKQEMLQGINEVKLQELSLYDVQVLPVNDRAAVVTYNAVVQMVVGSEDAPRYQHLSSVWVDQGGVWKLKFQQATAAQ